MEIRIDGSRASGDNWLLARRIPLSSLPALSVEELETAEKLGVAPEFYARSRYASDLTGDELGLRVESVAAFMTRWLNLYAPDWAITEAVFKTIEGKLRFKLRNRDGHHSSIFISEDLMEDLLDAGSSAAVDSFDRLLRANLDVPLHAKAS